MRDVCNAIKVQSADQFLIKDRYTEGTYQGIIPDTAATNVSIARKQKYLATQREKLIIYPDATTVGSTSIQFEKGDAIPSIRIVHVKAPSQPTMFHVLDTQNACLERRPLQQKERKRSRWPSLGPSRRPRLLQRFPRSSIAARDRAQQCLEQSVQGTYIASICQLKATFGLSIVAQAQDLEEEDYERLNRRIKWNMQNLQRGLRFVQVNMSSAKLMVLTDRSFANNFDLSSQLGYVILLVNEALDQDSFEYKAI